MTQIYRQPRYATTESTLRTILDAIESAGWDVRDVRVQSGIWWICRHRVSGDVFRFPNPDTLENATSLGATLAAHGIKVRGVTDKR